MLSKVFSGGAETWLTPVVFLQISLEAVESLGLLLEGSVGHGKGIQPVHRLLTKGPLQAQSGFSSLSRSFPLDKLLSCLQQNLTLNPFGMTACLQSGKKLAWAQQGVPQSAAFRLLQPQTCFLFSAL